MSVRVLNTTPIYTEERYQFIEKQAQYPDGEIRKKGCIQHPGSVVIIPFTDDGQVILIRQYRIGAEENLLEIPAGTLEPDEEPRLAAERELQEEAGFFPDTLIPLDGFYISPGISNEYMHLFIARDLRPSELAQDEDEIIEVMPMPLAEALRKITSNEIRDAKTIVGLLRASSTAF